MYDPTEDAALAEALFVSDLQASEGASDGTVRRIVAANLRRYGCDDCAARMAYEFGEHPDTAVRRISWARQRISTAFPPAGSRVA